MSKLNGNGQPWHPVEHIAFWDTKAPEIKKYADIYDTLVAGDPAKKKILDDLLSWACREAATDELYNQGEG